jgi:hypothetical protein
LVQFRSRRLTNPVISNIIRCLSYLLTLATASRVKSSSKKVALFEIERGEESTKGSDQSDGDGTGTVITADVPTNPEEAESTSVKDASERRNSGRIELHEVGKEGRAVSAPDRVDDLGGGQDRESVRTLIVLFDNSYSWYKLKEIK